MKNEKEKKLGSSEYEVIFFLFKTLFNIFVPPLKLLTLKLQCIS